MNTPGPGNRSVLPGELPTLPPAHRVLVVGSMVMIGLTVAALLQIAVRAPSCHDEGSCGLVTSAAIFFGTRAAFIAGFIGVSAYWFSHVRKLGDSRMFQFRLFRLAVPAAAFANLVIFLG